MQASAGPDAREARDLRLHAALARANAGEARGQDGASAVEGKPVAEEGRGQQQQGDKGAGNEGSGVSGAGLDTNTVPFHSGTPPRGGSLNAPAQGEDGGFPGAYGGSAGGAAGPPRRGRGGGRGGGGRRGDEEKARIEYEGGRVYEGELSARGSKKHGQVITACR